MKNIQISLDKEKYLRFIKENRTHIFNSQWWLDATFGQDWDSVIVESKGLVIGALPYCLSKKFGFNLISLPVLTQKMGPIIRRNEGLTNPEKVSYENKVFKMLIAGLPRVSHFNQNFDHSIQNWLPFFWTKYSQTTRYTYILREIQNHELLLKNISSSKRQYIKKGDGKIKIYFDLDAEIFYDFLKKNLRDKGQSIAYSLEQFTKIYMGAYQNNAGRAIYALDNQGELSGAVFLVWDDDCAYNLISTFNPGSSANGASSLLFYKAILYCSNFCKNFDFEGSTSESIEHSYRRFGGEQVPYFNIFKSTRLFKVCKALKDLWRGF